MDSRSKELQILIAVLSFAAILYLVYNPNGLFGLVSRVVLALIILIISGMLIRSVAGSDGGYGLYLLKSKSGIGFIDRVSKSHPEFWNQMAMWGFTVGFGALAYLMFRKEMDKRTFALGMATIFIMIMLVMPYIEIAVYQFINIPGLPPLSSAVAAPSLNLTPIGYLILAITLVVGFSGYVILLLLANAGSVIFKDLSFLAGVAVGHPNPGVLNGQVPGIAPLIPGVDIPFFASIISLIIILTIHEFSHGVLARIAKTKLKSVGLLMFGVIPIGAFVELDEKAVAKLSRLKQTRIFSAGISANFIATLLFAAILVIILMPLESSLISQGVFVAGVLPSYPANGILKAGMQVTSWNGHPITNISQLIAAGRGDIPNSTITVGTSNGTFSIPTVVDQSNSSHGVIGVSLTAKPITRGLPAKALYFLVSVVAISMLLNFLIAVVNLLPFVGFDGWRIYKSNTSSKVIKVVTILVVIAFVANALPWLLYL